MSSEFDIFVIGAGIAGLTAADEAAKRGLSVAIAEEAMFGGLALNVNHLNPAPEGAPPSGVDLATDLMTSVTDLGAEFLMEQVTAIAAQADGFLSVSTTEATHQARAVVLASGARLRKLGIPGEEEFEHRGVSHCADCDASFFKAKPVAVIGGGDSALQEALVLAEVCSEVHIIHRGAAFTANPEFITAVAANGTIKTHFRTEATSLEGSDALSAVHLRNLDSGESSVLACRGVFPFIGLEPNSALLPAELLGKDGAVRVDDRLQTGMSGVFAIGAVRAGYGGLLSDAARDANAVVETIAASLRASG